MRPTLAILRAWAQRLKRDVAALWLAARDPRVPWLAKIVAGLTAAYALSPIDLIPDIIPVLGLLDDLIIVPFGIWLALRLIPAPLMEALRAAASAANRPPASRMAALVIVMLWLVSLGGAAWWLIGR